MPTSHPPPSTTRPKPRPKPKAKAWSPRQPQPSASEAAYQILGAWAEQARAAALEYASPAAVHTLFAVRYPSGGYDFRGCSNPPANQPATCSVRVGDDLLQLTVTPFKSGWGVTAALVES